MKICVGNWKMNCSKKSLQDFIQNVPTCTFNDNIETIIALPYPYLYIDLPQTLQKSAQNCSEFEKGAYTGEISAKMLREFDVKYVIIGHSERRSLENNESIKNKLKRCVESNLKPILCVGEKIGECKKDIILGQLEAIESIKEVDVAYEPVWAIGTGKVATVEDVTEAIGIIKEVFNGRILYGGSVSAKNCLELSTIVDGFLVGNASLTNEFFKIRDSLL